MKTRNIILLTFFLTLFSGKMFAEEKFILVNQFGYLPDAQKIAMIRSPRVGSDASSQSKYPEPGATIKVVKSSTQSVVFAGTPVLIRGRASATGYYPNQIDPTSGDKVWHFDFSTLTTPGTYYILDEKNNHKSFEFKISEDVYVDLLNVAFKNFYFQRFNIAKEMPYCYDPVWSDKICYEQEKNTLSYMDKSNQTLKRDLSGGWFDAGDLNKYVNFLDMVIRNLLLAYQENPLVWDDNMGIPESGNDIPDLLDEIKWGLDWLLKMQNESGSVLSVVGGTNGASPPSADKGQRYYGLENTSSTLTFAVICSHAAQIFEKEPQQALKDYGLKLRQSAEKAWNWAEAHPNVKFYNNDEGRQPGSGGLCAGQAETDDVKPIKLRAAVYLFGLTRNDKYGHYIRDHYEEFPMVGWWGSLSEYHTSDHEACFYLNSLPDPPGYLIQPIQILRDRMKSRLNNNTFEYSIAQLVDYKRDAYMSFIDDYNWGSNSYKSAIGNCFRQLARTDWVNNISAGTYKELSANYVHYICGVNPMQYVYMTNMYQWGAKKCITQLYHTWFGDNTTWDTNPAPGYIPGGPNYLSENADGSKHFSATTPHAKCYIDFNTSWSNTVKPNSSWSITENSLGYQAPFVRLLANFVPQKRNVSISEIEKEIFEAKIYHNPAADLIQIILPEGVCLATVLVSDLSGRIILSEVQKDTNQTYPLAKLDKGIYIVSLRGDKLNSYEKIFKR